MRNTFKFKAMLRIAGIIALAAIIGFGFAACGDDGGGGYTFDPSLGSKNIGKKGPAGGIIFYYNASGFNVTGAGSFDAYYLEAAPTNQATSITWSSTYVNVTGIGTGIGRGKANTAAIIAAHPSDTASNNAAKAAVAYTGGDKNDWFLPSKDELEEMYKARTHLGISSGNFWSSSQSSGNSAWVHGFTGGVQSNENTAHHCYVRAVRAF